MSVPKLRFKEFDEAWKPSILADISNIVTGSTPATSKSEYYDGDFLFVSPADIQENRYVDATKTTLTKEGFNKCRHIPKNSILFVCIGSTIGKIAQNKEICATNQQINAVIPNNDHVSDFLYLVLDKLAPSIKLTAGVQAVPLINKTEFGKTELFTPTLGEQTKIATFLSAVDEKISHLTQKHKLLSQYKQGMMQKLFSQQIRFKADDGSEFGEWEEKSLLELSEKAMYGMNASATEYDGKNKYLRITDICESSHKFKTDSLTSPNAELEEKYKLNLGDLLFARTGASVGKSYLYNPNDGITYFAGFLIKFSLKQDKVNPYFIFVQTLTKDFDKWVATNSMRSGQPGINAEEYSSYIFKIPCLEEQTKIANSLSAIDQKTEVVAKQIEQAKQWKKGLLQQMFV